VGCGGSVIGALAAKARGPTLDSFFFFFFFFFLALFTKACCDFIELGKLVNVSQ